MHIVLIGGSGNLSTPCAQLLVAQGHRVSCVTRGSQPVPAGAKLLAADRHDPDSLGAALAGVEPDVVINFLGFTPAELELDYRLLAGRLRQYIFISSATVYAKPHQQLPINEQHPLGNAFSAYAQAKQQCEEWLRNHHDPDRFALTIVRPSHTFGPTWIPNLVQSTGYTFAHRLETGKPVFLCDDGQSRWTLTASADFARALAGLVGNAAASGETVHITSDQALSWQQIFAITAELLAVASPNIEYLPVETICQRAPEMVAKLKGDKAQDTVFDNSKIRQLVPGFRCAIGVVEAIAQSIAWFKADPAARCRVDARLDALYDRIVQHR